MLSQLHDREGLTMNDVMEQSQRRVNCIWLGRLALVARRTALRLPMFICRAVSSQRASIRNAAWSAAMSLLVVLANGPSATAQSSIAKPGLKFELVDQQGRRITDADLKGKPSVIHFGFTRCPVVCPTTLYELAGHMRELGNLADDINFVFVTVDPARDTPSFLAEYIESFDRRIICLSGDPQQIAALASGLGAVYSRVETSGGDYTVEHSVNAFLLDAGWQTVSTLYMGDGSNEAKVLQVLRSLASAGEPRKIATPNTNQTR
jgi:protein SCO1/2